MFLITLAEKGGGTEQREYHKNEITIGRLPGNDIILAKGNVSKYHSRIVAIRTSPGPSTGVTLSPIATASSPKPGTRATLQRTT